MIGDARPRGAGMHLGLLDRESAYVDAVEAKYGAFCRKTAARHTRLASFAAEDFAKADAFCEPRISLVAPVVEVAGNDQRRVRLGDAFQIGGKGVHLPSPRAGEKRKVYANTMDWRRRSGNIDSAVKQSATLEAEVGDVLVEGVLDREAGEYRVAVVAVIVCHVAGVCRRLPYLGGEKVVLRLLRPVLDARGMQAVLALDFLQEDDVSPELPQLLA